MKVELTVPNNWSDITIKQFQEFEENLNSKKTKKQKLITSICILCNIEKEVINKLKTIDLQEIALEINKLEKNEAHSIKFDKIFDYKGYTYALIPNMSEMTTGEFIDLETWCQDTTKNLHKIMSILFRPMIGKVNSYGQYKVESYDPTIEKENVMLDLPMDKALGCLNFFFHLGGQLISNLDNSLKRT